MKATWRLIVFDFDGVIADSMRVQEHAWRQAIGEVLDDSHVENRIIQNLYDGNAGERMFEGLEVTSDTKRRLRVAKDRIWLSISDSTRLMPGVSTVLPAIAARYPVAVATTADTNYVTRLLNRYRILPLIAKIVTDQDVANPKPAPDMLLRLMTDFGTGARNVCFVGDSRTDYLMSQSAGVDFIRFASHPGGEGIITPSVSSWLQLSRVLLGDGETAS